MTAQVRRGVWSPGFSRQGLPAATILKHSTIYGASMSHRLKPGLQTLDNGVSL